MPGTIYPLKNGGCHAPETPEALSPDNSSKILLGVAATFTGGGILTAGLIAFTILVETDKDGSLKLQSSPDNSVWNTDRTIILNTTNNRKVIENIDIQDTYFRIIYDNGETAQTAFRLQTVSHRDSSIQDVILQRIIKGELNTLKVGTLTSGRIVLAGASGLLADNSLFVWDGLKLGIGIAVPKKTLHCAKDGTNPSVLLLENSRPNSEGSVDETVRLTFGFGDKTNAVLFVVDKEKDFTELAKESAGFAIHTRKDGLTSQAMRIGADGSVTFVRGGLGVGVTAPNIIGRIDIKPDASTLDGILSRYGIYISGAVNPAIYIFESSTGFPRLRLNRNNLQDWSVEVGRGSADIIAFRSNNADSNIVDIDIRGWLKIAPGSSVISKIILYDGKSRTNNWTQIYNLGAAQRYDFQYNSTDILKLGSTGVVEIPNGALIIGKDLKHTGTKAGFYDTAPIIKQTGVAVTTAAIHAALVNLGFISA